MTETTSFWSTRRTFYQKSRAILRKDPLEMMRSTLQAVWTPNTLPMTSSQSLVCEKRLSFEHFSPVHIFWLKIKRKGRGVNPIFKEFLPKKVNFIVVFPCQFALPLFSPPFPRAALRALGGVKERGGGTEQPS